MNAPLTVEQLLPQLDHTHLDWLEEEAIFILREVAASFERPALLFSSGKDSCVVLHLAEKAFKMKNPETGKLEGKLPFPLLHVDTGHNFPEVLEYRDRRVAELEELTPAESAELMAFTQRMIQVIKSVSSPDAFNVGLNLGAAAGGSLADHLHQHIVPRWTGDANFITVIGDTKVLPQLLRETRQLLADAWRRLDDRETEDRA